MYIRLVVVTLTHLGLRFRHIISDAITPLPLFGVGLRLRLNPILGDLIASPRVR
jgi:hypothetical protein